MFDLMIVSTARDYDVTLNIGAIAKVSFQKLTE